MLESTAGVAEVENPAAVLRDESGLFEVTSPLGQVFRVYCRPGNLMKVREIGEPAEIPAGAFYGTTWRIRRLEEAGPSGRSPKPWPQQGRLTTHNGARRRTRRKPR